MRITIPLIMIFDRIDSKGSDKFPIILSKASEFQVFFPFSVALAYFCSCAVSDVLFMNFM